MKKRDIALIYLKSLAMVTGVTLLGWIFKEIVGSVNMDMFYFLIVVMVAVRWGRGPAVMTSVLSVVVFNSFFVQPYFSMPGIDLQSVILLTGFLIVGLLVSTLTSKIRQQAIESSEREMQVTMLYQLSKDLAAADTFDDVLNVIRTSVEKTFNGHVTIFLSEEHNFESYNFKSDIPADSDEKEIAAWVLENNLPAGLGTDVFKDSKTQYLPLRSSQKVFGVLGISLHDDKIEQEPQDIYLLNSLANQAASAIQRTKLSEVSRQIELMRETEKLQTALLNSISHDLRTPLVSIMGVLDTLLHDFSSLDQQTLEELLVTAMEDSDHLNRLVSNLLDMTRLEAKALKIHIEPCELRDVIGASLQPLKDEIEKRNIIIRIPDDFPEIPMDFVLMMRVFINLVDNAVKYSHPDTPITITAGQSAERVSIDVKDQGIGIPKDDLVRVFDKFYRAVKPRQITGTGLGLSICKGIVEAHGGTIFAKNNGDKGVTMSVTLPLNGKKE